MYIKEKFIKKTINLKKGTNSKDNSNNKDIY